MFLRQLFRITHWIHLLQPFFGHCRVPCALTVVLFEQTRNTPVARTWAIIVFMVNPLSVPPRCNIGKCVFELDLHCIAHTLSVKCLKRGHAGRFCGPWQRPPSVPRACSCLLPLCRLSATVEAVGIGITDQILFSSFIDCPDLTQHNLAALRDSSNFLNFFQRSYLTFS